MNLPSFSLPQLSTRQIGLLIIGAVVLILIITILVIYARDTTTTQPFRLNVWGIEPPQYFEPILTAYKSYRPNGDIVYRQIEEDEYQAELFNALAASEGPDVFMIRNRWLPRDKSKLVPAPSGQISSVGVQDLFPAAVEQDFVSGGEVYALPLYMDTMALLYNKDLLDNGGIVTPPKTWEEFRTNVGQLRAVQENNLLLRRAAALGTSERSVDAGVDLVHLLMMQNGAQMTDRDFRSATFATSNSGNNFGLQALNFYMQFADPASSVYTWDASEGNSIDSFAAGKTAMILNYHGALKTIKSKSPFLRAGIAPMPQPKSGTTAVNYADYWGLGVSKQTKANVADAWDFILFATANADAQRAYLDVAMHPPALRQLIGETLNDPEMGVFARQALTARSWYQIDDGKVNQIFNTMIDDIQAGRIDPNRALFQAQDTISQLMRRAGRDF